jgi:hypothetical protein
VSGGIAKIDQQAIPEELSHVAVVTSNHFGAPGLILAEHVTQVFWI